jgi:hypothetical protein
MFTANNSALKEKYRLSSPKAGRTSRLIRQCPRRLAGSAPWASSPASCTCFHGNVPQVGKFGFIDLDQDGKCRWRLRTRIRSTVSPGGTETARSPFAGGPVAGQWPVFQIKAPPPICCLSGAMDWKPISIAPFDRHLELAVLDRHGPHALVSRVAAFCPGGPKWRRRSGLMCYRRTGGRG